MGFRGANFHYDNRDLDIDQRLTKPPTHLTGHSSLVILHDLENLARLVNTVASANFNKREIENGVLHASDEDVDKAIQLWENLLQYRLQLYRLSSRKLTTIGDEICGYLARLGGATEDVPISELRLEFMMILPCLAKAPGSI